MLFIHVRFPTVKGPNLPLSLSAQSLIRSNKGPESIVHSKVSDVSMTQSITSMVGVNTSVLITACVGLSR